MRKLLWIVSLLAASLLSGCGYNEFQTRDEQVKVVESQIDVLGKAFQGMTIACARCHDHKFDAIRASDYYALAGFVRSSRYVQAPLHPCVGMSQLMLSTSRSCCSGQTRSSREVSPGIPCSGGPISWTTCGEEGSSMSTTSTPAFACEPEPSVRLPT